MRVYDRSAKGKAQSRQTVITSFGATVEYLVVNSRIQVTLRSALTALFPNLGSDSICSLFQLTCKLCPNLEVEAILTNNRGSGIYSITQDEFETLFHMLVKYSVKSINTRGKRFPTPEIGTYFQIIQGFDRWTRIPWFPPFE